MAHSSAWQAAVIGHPIAHSLSPVMHMAAYRELGLPYQYTAIDVAPEQLLDFLDGLDETWLGVSVTMPHKRVVRDFLVSESKIARHVGAVNTLLPSESGWVGDNTDVAGIIAALAPAGLDRVRAALILGGGATAASALAAVHQLGALRTTVFARNLSRVQDVQQAAGRMGADVAVEALALDQLTAAMATAAPEVVISTLPAGAADAYTGLAAAAAGVPHPVVLLDVAYEPWPSVLASSWQDAGCPVVSGLSMLVHQAVAQVQLMTGRPIDPQVLQQAAQVERAQRAARQSVKN